MTLTGNDTGEYSLRSIAILGCNRYSQIAVAHVTLPKAVPSTVKIFAVNHCNQGLTSCNVGHGRRNLFCHIRLQGNAATIGAPAILLEDFCPQAILKFHCPSSLDYSARHGLLDNHMVYLVAICKPVSITVSNQVNSLSRG